MQIRQRITLNELEKNVFGKSMTVLILKTAIVIYVFYFLFSMFNLNILFCKLNLKLLLYYLFIA
jgi:hypothetical protein